MKVRNKVTGVEGNAYPGYGGTWYSHSGFTKKGYSTKDALLEEWEDLDKVYFDVSANKVTLSRAKANLEKDLNTLKDQNYPDNNPKTVFGISKVPLHLVPPSVKHFLAKAFGDGAKKYGPYNWRDKKVSSSVYFAALNRHADAWWDGEDFAEDSGIEHLAHMVACIGILIDAATSGNLIDDRPTKGASPRLQKEYIKEGEIIERNDTDTVEQQRVSCCQENVCTPTQSRGC